MARRTPITPMHLRFWKRVAKSESGCWMWKGSVDGGGYGTISTCRGYAPAKAHRVSWEMRNGLIPQGMDICHRCDTPGCVNPEHLFLGSRKDNVHDCIRKGRLRPRGKPYQPHTLGESA